MHQPATFQQHPATHSGVIDYSTHFPDPLFQEAIS